MKHHTTAFLPTGSSPLTTQRWLPFAAACLLAAGTLSGVAPASAKTKSARPKPADSAPAAKRKGVSKVTYQRSSSEETSAEHDRRMYRECKGLHNAGACRGYTRK